MQHYQLRQHTATLLGSDWWLRGMRTEFGHKDEYKEHLLDLALSERLKIDPKKYKRPNPWRAYYSVLDNVPTHW